MLVNDIFGLTKMEWNVPVWKPTSKTGLHLSRRNRHACDHEPLRDPLLLRTLGGLAVEVNDGTDEYNATIYRVSFFYDLTKAAVGRMAFALAHELEARDVTALSVTPGWLRSEAMLDVYEVTERTARRNQARAALRHHRDAPLHRARHRGPGRRSGQARCTASRSRHSICSATNVNAIDGSPDAWRYIVEVQDADKLADVTGYR